MTFDSSLPLFLDLTLLLVSLPLSPQQHQGMGVVVSSHTLSLLLLFLLREKTPHPSLPQGTQRFCFPFLSALSGRQHHCCWWAQSCPDLEPGWHCLHRNKGRLLAAPTETTPVAPQCQTLATKPNPPTLQQVFLPLFFDYIPVCRRKAVSMGKNGCLTASCRRQLSVHYCSLQLDSL